MKNFNSARTISLNWDINLFSFTNLKLSFVTRYFIYFKTSAREALKKYTDLFLSSVNKDLIWTYFVCVLKETNLFDYVTKTLLYGYSVRCQLFQRFTSICQKRLSKGVLKKECSENMQEICRCNFIEIALRHGCSPVNLLHIFKTLFPKNTSGRLLLIPLRIFLTKFIG